MNDTLEIGDLTFHVRHSLRRRTLGLMVGRGAELILNCPVDADAQKVAKWAQSKLLWVHRQLARKEQMGEGGYVPEFTTGENFFYLGRSYRLKVSKQQPGPLSFDGNWFWLQRDAMSNAAKHFRNWYIQHGRVWLTERTASLVRRTGVSPAKIDVRDLGFRWGSCGKSLTLCFNWRLLQLPKRLIDYVIVHELVHLREPYHGDKFRRLLELALPDWEQRSEELRLKGSTFAIL